MPTSNVERPSIIKPFRTLRSGSLWAAILVLQSGCSGTPDGVEPVSGFELDRYLGTWYEIARLDHRFERGLSEVTATYRMREDGGVHVINRGYKLAQQGQH